MGSPKKETVEDLQNWFQENKISEKSLSSCCSHCSFIELDYHTNTSYSYINTKATLNPVTVYSLQTVRVDYISAKVLREYLEDDDDAKITMRLASLDNPILTIEISKTIEETRSWYLNRLKHYRKSIMDAKKSKSRPNKELK